MFSNFVVATGSIDRAFRCKKIFSVDRNISWKGTVEYENCVSVRVCTHKFSKNWDVMLKRLFFISTHVMSHMFCY